MNRRSLHRLAYVVIALQALSFAPQVLASSAAPAAASSESPCADMTSHAGETQPCPCCPEGAAGIAACLNACIAAVGNSSSFAMSVAMPVSGPVRTTSFAPRTKLSDPPLKPPPIA